MFHRKPILAKALGHSNPFHGLRLLADAITRVAAAEKGRTPIPVAHARILHVLDLIVEVSNGTLVQYFWNSSGDNANALEDDLACIGCHELLLAIAAARMEVFGGPSPSDILARRLAMKAFFHTHPFNDDDDTHRLSQLAPSPMCARATALIRATDTALPRKTLEWAHLNSTAFTRLR